MLVAKGLAMLEVSAAMMGRKETVYPALIWDEDQMILVDTAYPGQLPLLRAEMERAGMPFEKLTKLIITHQDLDHIGNLPTILHESAQKLEVLAHAVEKPFIQGEKRLLKITPEAIAQAVNSLPPEVPEEWRAAFKRTLENPPKADVDRTVGDAEELPYCGGITVISTPGHTPGHISLYHRPSKTLIAADAMIVADGQLLGPEPQYCVDANQAVQSLKKLTHYDIEAVICYHGGLYRGDANRRIAELANG
ncbi:MBL fold metallo-hydrolase [Brevibacillus massiliensis]|jgi:glyoxylase-like metal-dependent hydrolase (beta-lactamase superfamily II)|uniref:MBL fold metallo-hydrolase n=1 Tax=Brevibacillus massiliensis TaxID=1118054 RepID=UPI0004747C6C|nr:MBL fold metallo-hydrolase [Brevibacillus massiliensis]